MINDYITFLRFKSISADPAYREDCLACVQWLQNFLSEFKTALWPTRTNPTLFAEDLSAGPEAPTVLFYQHYDVQPVDPLDLWESDPFEPRIVGDTIYARGAQDNKGQCFYVLAALKAYKKEHGRFPINVKIVIEGDEEMGSIGLKEIAAQHASDLKADYLLITDIGLKSLEAPAITLGTRGLITMELIVQGPQEDQHSGDRGGIVYNPLHALVLLLAAVHDERGRVTIPGFYDHVVMPQDELDLTWGDKVSAAGGERHDYTPYERAWLRPTFEINGINGGYSGPGFKTVIPAKAFAKLSCRLVPNQEPHQIFSLVKHFFHSHKPDGVEIALSLLQEGSPAVRTSATSPLAKAASLAYEKVFGKKCGKIMCGGTIGIATALTEASGATALFIGLGLSDDQIHAPNERFSLSRIKQGMALITEIINNL